MLLLEVAMCTPETRTLVGNGGAARALTGK
jgi:hypothetical protein